VTIYFWGILLHYWKGMVYCGMGKKGEREGKRKEGREGGGRNYVCNISTGKVLSLPPPFPPF